MKTVAERERYLHFKQAGRLDVNTLESFREHLLQVMEVKQVLFLIARV